MKPSSNQFSSRTYLAKLNIPTFNGNIVEWASFINMFTSNVDRDASLRGKPLVIVHNLPVIDVNYPVALVKLKEKYDHKRLISSHHLNMLFKLPY